MKAAGKVKGGKGVSLFEVEKPRPGRREVLVRVRVASICGTDIHYYRGGGEVKGGPMVYPKILGHEMAGEVVEVGEEVEGVEVGDRVSGETHIPCGVCRNCRTGRMNICLNWNYPPGCFAEYVIWPSYCIIKLPDAVSYEEGALLEAFGSSVYSVKKAEIKPGDVVVVVGCGPIGIWCQQLAGICGASKVISTDVSKYRLELSRRIADVSEVIDAAEVDAVKRIQEITGGGRADVVFETSGSPAGFYSALEMAGNGGRVVMVGLVNQEVTFTPKKYFFDRELSLHGVCGREIFTSWERALRMISSKMIDVTQMVTHRFSLEEVEKAFELADSRRAGKIQLYP